MKGPNRAQNDKDCDGELPIAIDKITTSLQCNSLYEQNSDLVNNKLIVVYA